MRWRPVRPLVAAVAGAPFCFAFWFWLVVVVVLSSLSSLLSLLLVCFGSGCRFRFRLVLLALGVGRALAGPLGVAAGWLWFGSGLVCRRRCCWLCCCVRFAVAAAFAAPCCRPSSALPSFLRFAAPLFLFRLSCFLRSPPPCLASCPLRPAPPLVCIVLCTFSSLYDGRRVRVTSLLLE